MLDMVAAHEFKPGNWLDGGNLMYDRWRADKS